jgi:hypothetical protein
MYERCDVIYFIRSLSLRSLLVRNEKSVFEMTKSAFEMTKSAFETTRSVFETTRSAFERLTLNPSAAAVPLHFR